MLYDQIVEFARERQRKRRRAGVHKRVPNPIAVLVLGDSGLASLDALYAQLTARWSSQMEALQLCYCYVDAPYRGNNPILQTKLELPQDGVEGPGALCTLPETLSAVNEMAGEMIARMSAAPQIAMQVANLHVVLAPEDPASPLLSDLAAVIRGRLADFGAVSNDCRLHLLLPQQYATEAQRLRVSGVMDQLRQADQEPYDQPVLQPQKGAAPRPYRAKRLLNGVMLLDDMNEKFQRYNTHGERLTLLVDLIENEWAGGGYIFTAGVQDGSAGPEYWLAQAADALCARVLSQEGDGGVSFEAVRAAIAQAVQERMRGMERALAGCCLFHPGQVGRIGAGTSMDEGERAVFGGALQSAYQSWLDGMPPLALPAQVEALLDQADSEQSLEKLVEDLRDWAAGGENSCTQPPLQNCQKFHAAGGEAESAARFRDFLRQTKYTPMSKNDEQRACAALARLCVKDCRRRMEDLDGEQAEFDEFAQQVQDAWVTLRDGFNGGVPMPLNWLNPPPSPGALRRAGAKAARSGDAAEVLALIADCVDLSGGAVKSAGYPDPPLFCRIPITMGIDTQTKLIQQGISAGRMLKFASISAGYAESSIQRVFILAKARPDVSEDGITVDGGNENG